MSRHQKTMLYLLHYGLNSMGFGLVPLPLRATRAKLSSDNIPFAVGAGQMVPVAQGNE